MRRFAWILTLPITVIVVLFAVMNRVAVPVELWPLPWQPDLPLFLVIFGAALVGFLVGALATWGSGARQRRVARHAERQIEEQRQRIAALSRELVTAQAQIHNSGHGPSQGALPAPRRADDFFLPPAA